MEGKRSGPWGLLAVLACVCGGDADGQGGGDASATGGPGIPSLG